MTVVYVSSGPPPGPPPLDLKKYDIVEHVEPVGKKSVRFADDDDDEDEEWEGTSGSESDEEKGDEAESGDEEESSSSQVRNETHFEMTMSLISSKASLTIEMFTMRTISECLEFF